MAPLPVFHRPQSITSHDTSLSSLRTGDCNSSENSGSGGSVSIGPNASFKNNNSHSQPPTSDYLGKRLMWLKCGYISSLILVLKHLRTKYSSTPSLGVSVIKERVSMLFLTGLMTATIQELKVKLTQVVKFLCKKRYMQFRYVRSQRAIHSVLSSTCEIERSCAI